MNDKTDKPAEDKFTIEFTPATPARAKITFDDGSVIVMSVSERRLVGFCALYPPDRILDGEYSDMIASRMLAVLETFERYRNNA